MKKIFFATVVGLLLLACSVDNDDINLKSDSIEYANSIMEVEGCKTETFSLIHKMEVVGEVKITNDISTLYINFLAKEGYSITGIKWDVLQEHNSLPINNGGVIPGQLSYQEKLNKGTSRFEKSFPLKNFDSDCLVLSARVSFKNARNQTFHVWLKNSDLQFIDYCICAISQDEPNCTINAGRDLEKDLSFQFVDEYVEDLGDIRKLLFSLLDEETDKDGFFLPDSRTLRDRFAVNPYQTFIIEYNIVEGDCRDVAILTINIIP